MPPALPILYALVPVNIILLTGFALQRLDFPGKHFWTGAERLTYYLLFPVLLFHSTATADWQSISVAGLSQSLLAGFFLISLLLLFLRPWLTANDAAFTSIFQGSIRFTTYIGFAIADAALGSRGLALSAAAITLLIPMVNILSVLVLIRYGRRNESGWRQLLREIVTNPMLIACLLGSALHLTGLHLPPVAAESCRILGRASLPLGLLAVGASLDVNTVRTIGRPIVYSTILKLIFLPLLMSGICLILNIDRTAAFIAILFAGLPTSPLSFILARQLGGDAPLMASIITAQLVSAMITLPCILAATAFIR